MTIPAFVPPKLVGQLHFCDAPANLITDAPCPIGIPFGNRGDPWNQYGANVTLFHDALGEPIGIGLRASGHHPAGDNNPGIAYLDISNPAVLPFQWSWRNAGSFLYKDASSGVPPLPDTTGMYSDGGYQALHGYKTMAEFPISFGGHPDAMVIGQTAPSGAVRLDTTQATLGYTSIAFGMTGFDSQGNGQYMRVALATELNGFFCCSAGGINNWTTFLTKDGVFSDQSYPLVMDGSANASGNIWYDDFHHLLCGISGGNFYLYSDVTRPRNHFFVISVDCSNPAVMPTKPSYVANVIGETADRPDVYGGNLPTNDIEKGGLEWCPQRDCMYSFDIWHGNRILRIKPPAVGDRKTADWISEEMTAVHWPSDTAGSPTLRFPSQFATGGSAWVGLKWIPQWDCFFYPGNEQFPAQLIRPPDGGGPDPAPAPTPPGPATALQWGMVPTTGTVGIPSSSITVGANGNLDAGAVTVTLNVSPGATVNPTTRVISNASPVGSFTITPPATGNYTLTLTNSAALTNPSSRNYAATAGAPPPTGTRSLSITIKNPGGLIAANYTNLSVAVFDQATPDLYLAPIYKSPSGSTDAAGTFTLSLPASLLPVGGVAGVMVCDATGVPFFNGPVTLS